MQTQVAIIGAGPAGLLLSHLLAREGIDNVVLERHSRVHVEARIRAGVLEETTVEVLERAGLAARLKREGLRHTGIQIRFAGTRHRIDFASLTGGRTITVYGQHELIKDMIAARLAAGGRILFECPAVALEGFLDCSRPVVRYQSSGGREEALMADFIAGCDGHHGITRASVPREACRVFERSYPFGWLGILAETPPVSDELIYCHHDRGFALFSMRSPTLSRLYVQCAADDPLDDWPDARVWDELAMRLGPEAAHPLVPGPVREKSIARLRSCVIEPMRFGRLFLAGDAAHIVPPTGAKGLNLAVADIHVLARALRAHYREGQSDLLDTYSGICLNRVWKVERFSWWMTALLHKFPGLSAFDERLQLAELSYLVSSRAAATTLAENYVGLPLA